MRPQGGDAARHHLLRHPPEGRGIEGLQAVDVEAHWPYIGLTLPRKVKPWPRSFTGSVPQGQLRLPAARPDTGETACIDTPEADRILAEAGAKGWRITQIWTTHWHPDHAGGNAAIKAATGCRIVGPKGEAEKIPTLERQLVEGDTVKLGSLTAACSTRRATRSAHRLSSARAEDRLRRRHAVRAWLRTFVRGNGAPDVDQPHQAARHAGRHGDLLRP